MEQNRFKAILGILRVSMGLIFSWAFLDKVFGLGFATAVEKAWLAGGSPTSGFLQFGVHGPFADFYHSLAGSGMVDWLFMLGLLFVGISLTFGIFVKLGGLTGILMLLLMYTAVGLPPKNHPFIDEHIIYILVMGILMLGDTGKYFGFGNVWARTAFVQKFTILK
ncbi:MAG: hypothetical protein Q7R65_00190 [bacterium]|nr:hypothetical protein [bacterium]